MSQEDVLKALEASENELSVEELARIVEINATAVRNCLKRLLKGNEVERVELTKKEVIALKKSYSGRHYRWKIKE